MLERSDPFNNLKDRASIDCQEHLLWKKHFSEKLSFCFLLGSSSEPEVNCWFSKRLSDKTHQSHGRFEFIYCRMMRWQIMKAFGCWCLVNQAYLLDLRNVHFYSCPADLLQLGTLIKIRRFRFLIVTRGRLNRQRISN